MQRATRLSIAAFAVAIIGGGALARAALSKPTEVKVKFSASGPAGLKIEGATNRLDVTEEAGNVIISVPLATVQTGIDVRDRHMKEDLEVEKFPQAQLTVERSAIKFPAGAEKTTGDAPGTLQLHGQSRPATVHYEVKGDGGAFVVDGKIHINMKEVGIEVRSYLGVTVKPDVDVDVHFRVSGS